MSAEDIAREAAQRIVDDTLGYGLDRHMIERCVLGAIRSAVQAETEERLTLSRHVVEFLDDLEASANPCLDASNPQASAFHMLRAEARSRGDK